MGYPQIGRMWRSAVSSRVLSREWSERRRGPRIRRLQQQEKESFLPRLNSSIFSTSHASFNIFVYHRRRHLFFQVVYFMVEQERSLANSILEAMDARRTVEGYRSNLSQKGRGLKAPSSSYAVSTLFTSGTFCFKILS